MSATVIELAEARKPVKKFTINRYTEADIDDVVREFRAMHSESVYRDIPIDEVLVVAKLKLYLQQDTHLGLVARDEEGELIGFSSFYAAPFFFSDKLAAFDRGTYVIPSWRGSTVFIRMLKLVQLWAKDRGVVELVIGTTTGVKSERVEKLYERLGFNRVGGVYKMRMT